MLYLFLKKNALAALLLVILIYLAGNQFAIGIQQIVQHVQLYSSADRIEGTVASLQLSWDGNFKSANIECPIIRFQNQQGKTRHFISDDCRWFKPITKSLSLPFPPFINHYQQQQTVTILYDGKSDAEIEGFVVLVLIPLFNLLFGLVCFCLAFALFQHFRKK